jgi:hypothetical protein
MPHLTAHLWRPNPSIGGKGIWRMHHVMRIVILIMIVIT